METTEEIEKLNKEYHQMLIEEDIKLKQLKLEWYKNLKGMCNVSVLFKWLDSNCDGWRPIGIVEIYNTDEKSGGYSSYQHVRIKDDKDNLLYMMQDENEIYGINHCCVWQTCGMMGDDYSGYLLYPMKDGRYFKVSYYC
jgi:hypothetical protein